MFWNCALCFEFEPALNWNRFLAVQRHSLSSINGLFFYLRNMSSCCWPAHRPRTHSRFNLITRKLRNLNKRLYWSWHRYYEKLSFPGFLCVSCPLPFLSSFSFLFFNTFLQFLSSFSFLFFNTFLPFLSSFSFLFFNTFLPFLSSFSFL